MSTCLAHRRAVRVHERRGEPRQRAWSLSLSDVSAWDAYGCFVLQRDLVLPRTYPLPASADAPAPAVRLRLRTAAHSLRCRPGELYLGASTTQGQMSIFTCTDANTWDPVVVLEWMEEVKGAALFYLGDSTLQERDSPLARL